MQRAKGCDGSGGTPLFSVDPCPGCRHFASTCGLCGGSGVWILHRCPGLDAPFEAMRMIESAIMASEGIGWPAAGGVDDQSSEFLHAWRLVVQQRSLYEKRNRADG